MADALPLAVAAPEAVPIEPVGWGVQVASPLADTPIVPVAVQLAAMEPESDSDAPLTEALLVLDTDAEPLALDSPDTVPIEPVAFCDAEPVAAPVAVPLEILGQALTLATALEDREAATDREGLPDTEEVFDTEDDPVSVTLTTPVRDPPFEPVPDTVRAPVEVSRVVGLYDTVLRPDADSLPVTDTEPLTVAGLKEAEAEGDTEAEAQPEAEGCGEGEEDSEGKEAVASAVSDLAPVPETEPDFVMVCVKVCVQVK